MNVAVNKVETDNRKFSVVSFCKICLDRVRVFCREAVSLSREHWLKRSLSLTQAQTAVKRLPLWLPAIHKKTKTFDPSKQRGAFALIVVGQGTDRKYLLQWNAKWGVFNMIGGKLDNTKGDNNSLTRTICRELEEELGLKSPGECCIVRELKRVQMQQFSQRDQTIKDYDFSVFEVDLFPQLPGDQSKLTGAARWLSTNRENVFASREEVNNLKTASGRPISTTTWRLLNAVGELSSC